MDSFSAYILKKSCIFLHTSNQPRRIPLRNYALDVFIDTKKYLDRKVSKITPGHRTRIYERAGKKKKKEKQLLSRDCNIHSWMHYPLTNFTRIWWNLSSVKTIILICFYRESGATWKINWLFHWNCSEIVQKCYAVDELISNG